METINGWDAASFARFVLNESEGDFEGALSALCSGEFLAGYFGDSEEERDLVDDAYSIIEEMRDDV